MIMCYDKREELRQRKQASIKMPALTKSSKLTEKLIHSI